MPGHSSNSEGSVGVVLGHLDPDPEPGPLAVVDEEQHDLEALGRRRRPGSGPARMGQVVDAEHVEALVVAVVEQVAQQVEVLLAGGVDDRLARGCRDVGQPWRVGAAAGVVGVGRRRRGSLVATSAMGQRATLRVTGWVWGIASTCTSAPAPVWSRRRMMSPVSMFLRSVVMAWISVSGVGGQPGA